MGYVFLIIANLAGFLKGIAMKQSGRVCAGAYNSVRINALRALICAIVSVAICAFFGMKTETEYWWIWLISGVSNALMMFIWILCSEKVGLVVVETFGLIGSVMIPLVLSPILYHGESVNAWQWLGCVCLLAAVVVLSLKPKLKNAAGHENNHEKTGGYEEKPRLSVSDSVVEKDLTATVDLTGETTKTSKKKFPFQTVVYIALYVLSTAGVCITQKLYPMRAGNDYVLFFNMMTFFVVFSCLFIVLITGKVFFKKSLFPEKADSGKKLAFYVSLAAVMIYLYQLFAALASGILSSAILYPLSRGMFMLLTTVSEVTVFKQKITLNMCVGLILTFLAIVFTNL